MSQANKNLKLCCFATIIVGCAALVVSIVSIVGGAASTEDYFGSVLGAFCAFFALWAARAANVPSNAPTIAKAALVVSVLCLLGICISVWLNSEHLSLLPLVLVGVLFVCTGLILLFARSVRKEQEQKR